MPCYTDGDLTLCTGGPWRTLAVEPAGERWCFACRKRRTFTDTLSTDDSPWYEPTWARRCEVGHYDGDLFPGWSRDAG